jgi:cytochrome c
MNRSKKLVLILSVTVLAAACGNSGETKSADTPKDTATTSTKAPAPAAAASDDKGLELIGASDCTTCHRLHKAASGAAIGPAYDEVAAKYSSANAADSTVNRLVKKIIAGGSGVWGTVPMTPHPSVPEADIKTMVKYILTLKQ